MSLRVNNNIQAMNAHRNLIKNESMINKSLERLSSGMKINRGADGAAGLIISEQQRAQIAGINQAIANSTDGVSMVQTAEGGLDEMSSLLNKARTLALHSANEGANDQAQLTADQTELDNITASIDRIAGTTQFGNKKMLDGSLSSFRSNDSATVGAVRTGNHYTESLKTGIITRGYHSLIVTANATKGSLVISGGAGDVVDTGSSAYVTTGGAAGVATIDGMSGTATFKTAFTVAINGNNITIASGQSKNDLIAAINSLGRSLGFVATVNSGTVSSFSGGISSVGTGSIVVLNNKYGSNADISFAFVAGTTGATQFSGVYADGVDLAATLLLYSGAAGGTAGTGSTVAINLVQTGSNLTLVSSNALDGYRIDLKQALTITGGTNQSGLYQGVIDGMNAGATFQVGANVNQTATVTLNSMRVGDLGNGASTDITSLASLAGQLAGGNAQEALKVIDKAITDVTITRGTLGAFQSNTLETTISSLRVASENLTAAESAVRDVDFAEESARFTKYNILMQSATAMMAQANQLPQGVLKLLG